MEDPLHLVLCALPLAKLLRRPCRQLGRALVAEELGLAMFVCRFEGDELRVCIGIVGLVRMESLRQATILPIELLGVCRARNAEEHLDDCQKNLPPKNRKKTISRKKITMAAVIEELDDVPMASDAVAAVASSDAEHAILVQAQNLQTLSTMLEKMAGQNQQFMDLVLQGKLVRAPDANTARAHSTPSSSSRFPTASADEGDVANVMRKYMKAGLLARLRELGENDPSLAKCSKKELARYLVEKATPEDGM